MLGINRIVQLSVFKVKKFKNVLPPKRFWNVQNQKIRKVPFHRFNFRYYKIVSNSSSKNSSYIESFVFANFLNML